MELPIRIIKCRYDLKCHWLDDEITIILEIIADTSVVESNALGYFTLVASSARPIAENQLCRERFVDFHRMETTRRGGNLWEREYFFT